MGFAKVIGQQHVKDRLIECVNRGRVPHALLFWGNEGAGKFALAMAFAQYLNCSSPHDGDSCGECLSCRQFRALQDGNGHFFPPDLHFVFPYVKTESKKLCDDYLQEWYGMLRTSSFYFNMETWLSSMAGEKKQALIYSDESNEISRKLSHKSFEGKYSITVFWLPERMHEVCANKLLKLLEEPPENTIFLLVCQSPEKLLPTIVSRTQMIHVPPIAYEDLRKIFPDDVARVADGNYVLARALTEDDGDLQFQMQMFRNLMLMVFRRDLVSLKDFAENMAAKGREYSTSFLSYSQRLLRESFIATLNRSELNYLSSGEAAFISKFKNFVNVFNIERLYEIFAGASTDIERNVNTKIVLFDMGLQLMTQIKKKDITD